MSSRKQLVNFIEEILYSCDHDSFRGGVQYKKGENRITPKDEVYWIIHDEICPTDPTAAPLTEWRFRTRSYDRKNLGRGDILTAFVYDLEKNPKMERHMKIDNVRQFLCGTNDRYLVQV